MAEGLFAELSIGVLAIFWLFWKFLFTAITKTTSGSPLDKTRRNKKTTDSRNLGGSPIASKFQDVSQSRLESNATYKWTYMYK